MIEHFDVIKATSLSGSQIAISNTQKSYIFDKSEFLRHLNF
jgi:hypothetical protein